MILAANAAVGVITETNAEKALEIDISGDHKGVFREIQELKICLDKSLLYESYALFLEANGAMNEAHYVYQLGISRVLVSQRRSTRSDLAAYKALEQVVPKHHLPGRMINYSDTHGAKFFQQLLKGQKSLAEYPFGSILHSIESAPGSAPLLSLIAPLDSLSQESYWKAPTTTSSAEFVIVLGNLSNVSGVVLVLSPCGYSMSDSPTVQVWASNKVDKAERTIMGKWDVGSIITSSPELCGPEKPGNPRHINFSFRNPVCCRIIWIKMSIQKVGSSASFSNDFDLLSLDENPFSRSLSLPMETDPCLHAKRIIVVGNPVKIDTPAAQNSDRSSIKNWLEKAPPLNRFKVPVEAERLIDN